MGKIIGKAFGAIADIFGLGMEEPQTTTQDNRLQTSTDPNKYFDLLYGVSRVAGHVVFEHTGGEGNKYYYQVRVLGYGPMQGLVSTLMDDKPITEPEIYPYIKLEWFPGSNSQNLYQESEILSEIPQVWGETDRLAGLACVVLRFENVPEKFTRIGNMLFTVQGRVIQDIRTGAQVFSDNPALCVLDLITNSVYGWGVKDYDRDSFISLADKHDELDDSEIEAVSGLCNVKPQQLLSGYIFTQDGFYAPKLIVGQRYRVSSLGNPVFSGVLLDITRTGGFTPWEGDVGYGDFNDPPEREYRLFFEEIKGLSLEGELTLDIQAIEKTYTCNGVATSASKKENLLQLLSSFSGTLSFPNGIATLLADELVAAVGLLDLSEDDFLLGTVTVEQPSESTIYNQCSADIVDSNKAFDKTSVSVFSEVLYTRDGSVRKSTELKLPFTNDPTMAERLCYITLNKSRHRTLIQFKASWQLLRYTVGDVVQVVDKDFGWTLDNPRYFRFIKIGVPSIANDVKIVMESYVPEDYTKLSINLRLPETYSEVLPQTDMQPPTEVMGNFVTSGASTFIRIEWKHSAFRNYGFRLEAVHLIRDAQGVVVEVVSVINENTLEFFYLLDASLLTLGNFYQFRVYAYITPEEHTLAYGYTNYEYKGLPTPDEITLRVVSPWVIEIYPEYTESPQQTRLSHEVYALALSDDYLTDAKKNPISFTNATMIGKAPNFLSWSGAIPGIPYMFWCRATTENGLTSLLFPGKYNGTPPRWEVSDGRIAQTLKPSEAQIGVSFADLILVSSAQVISSIDGVNEPSYIGFYVKTSGLPENSQVTWSVTPDTLTLYSDSAGESVIGTHFINTAEVPNDLAEFVVEVTTGEAESLYTDQVTVVVVKSGSDSLTAYLTSESVTLTENNGEYLEGRDIQGRMKVLKGTEDVSSEAMFFVQNTTNNLGVVFEGNRYIVTSVNEGYSEAQLVADYNGEPLTKTLRVNTVKNGQRGNATISIETQVNFWSDDLANTALESYGGPKNLDKVTQFNSSAGFIETRIFDGLGSIWNESESVVAGTDIIGTIPDGNLSDGVNAAVNGFEAIDSRLSEIDERTRDIETDYGSILDFGASSAEEYQDIILDLLNKNLVNSELLQDTSNVKNEIKTWQLRVDEDLRQLALDSGYILPSEWLALNVTVDGLSGAISTAVTKQIDLEESIQTQRSELTQLSDSVELLVSTTDIDEVGGKYTELLQRLDGLENSITQQALAVQGPSLEGIGQAISDAIRDSDSALRDLDISLARTGIQAVADAQGQMAQQQLLLIAQSDGNQAAVQSLSQALTNTDNAIAQTKTQLDSSFLEAKASIENVSQTFASQFEALATQQSALQSQVSEANADSQANISRIDQTLATLDESVATAKTNLETTFQTAQTQTLAKFAEVDQTIASQEEAFSQQISDLQAELNTVDTQTNARISNVQSALASDIEAVSEEVTLLTSKTSADNQTLSASIIQTNQAVSQLESETASALSQISTSVSQNADNISSASLTIASNTDEINGLSSKVVLQADANGKVGYISLSGDETGSAIIFSSDSIQVVNPITQAVDLGYEAVTGEMTFYGPVIAKKIRGDLTDGTVFTLSEQDIQSSILALDVSVKPLEFDKILVLSGISISCRYNDISQRDALFSLRVITRIGDVVVSSQRRSATYGAGFVASSQVGVEVPANSGVGRLSIEVLVESNPYGTLTLDDQQVVITSLKKGTSFI